MRDQKQQQEYTAEFRESVADCLTNLSLFGYQIVKNPGEIPHSAPEIRRRLNWQVYNDAKNVPDLDQRLRKGRIV